MPAKLRRAPAAAETEPQRAAKGGVDRARAVLVAAERLFAEEGYDAVSLRRIADEAKVPLALIDYHFGRKEELFAAVFARGSRNVEQRVAALDEVFARPGRPAGKVALRRIVEAFVEPVLSREAHSPGTYALLAARELLSRDTPLNRRVLQTHFDPMAHAFIDGLNRAFPRATRGEVAWCYQFALGAFVHYLTDFRVERLSRGASRRRDPAAAALLTRFIVGGLMEVLASKRTVPA